MQLQSLPRSFDYKSGLTMPVYRDHFLFAEDLQQPFRYPEHKSAMGILLTGKGTCDYYINGIKNQVYNNKVLFINRNSRLEIRIEDRESSPILLFFNSRFPDLVQYSQLNEGEPLQRPPPGWRSSNGCPAPKNGWKRIIIQRSAWKI